MKNSHDGVVLDGSGENHAVYLPVVDGAHQGRKAVIGGQAQQDVVVLQEGFLAYVAHTLTDVGKVQLDERLRQNQRNIIGAAFCQTFGGGIGAVVVLADVFLYSDTGGFADTPLTGNSTGNGGFGHTQIPGDVIDG